MPEFEPPVLRPSLKKRFVIKDETPEEIAMKRSVVPKVLWCVKGW